MAPGILTPGIFKYRHHYELITRSCGDYRRCRPNWLLAFVSHRLGRDVWTGTTCRIALDRNRTCLARLAGRGDGAGRLRLSAAQGSRPDGEPGRRFPRGELGAASRECPAQGGDGTQGLAGHQRQDLCGPGPGHTEERRARRAHPGGREPVQHELPHCHEPRPGGSARPVFRNDTPRPEPRQIAARQESGRRCRGSHQCRHLGQSLGHTVS